MNDTDPTQLSLFVKDHEALSGYSVNPEAADPNSLIGRAHDMSLKAAKEIIGAATSVPKANPTYGNQGRSPASAELLREQDKAQWKQITKE